MVNFSLNIYQLIFVIAVPIVVLIVAFFLIFLPLRKRSYRKNYDEYYYKTIHRIVTDEDYYLINRFIYKIDDTKTGTIDHIIFGEKYFYLISSKYYEGDITGKQFDKSLILIDNHGKKFYVDNPFLESKLLLERLSLNTEVDTSLMIGIVIVNKRVNINVENESKQYYAIQINKLPQLIKAIESRPIPNINEQQLARAVKVFDKLNRRRD